MFKKKLIYFDNAATSNYKPKSVIYCVKKALKNSANPGRSGHKLSIKNAQDVWSTRETVSKHFGGINPENIIFTKNCTEALNIAILGTIKEGGNVICSCFEHNSVLRPLTYLQNIGKITLTIIEPKNKKYITKQDIEEKILSKTYLVCLTAVSNVLGNKNDIEEISKLCHSKNILFLCDFAQGAGHYKIDIVKNKINLLAFAGHKGFLAPQGIGGLCINCNKLINPIMFGGTGTESINTSQPLNLPESLESGTLNTPAIIGLKKGINYIDKNFERHKKKVEFLTNYLMQNLLAIPNLKIYSNNCLSSGVVAFNIKNCDSTEISEFLDFKYNIATRSGLHCAPLTHNYLGTTDLGLVRISLNFKNTKKEINTLIKAIKEFCKDKENCQV